MGSLRNSRAFVTALWLVMQGALLIAPSVVLLTAHEETAECTCMHGEHAICPMHHRPAPGSRILSTSSGNEKAWFFSVRARSTQAASAASQRRVKQRSVARAPV